jgi:hypothetical protein
MEFGFEIAEQALQYIAMVIGIVFIVYFGTRAIIETWTPGPKTIVRPMMIVDVDGNCQCPDCKQANSTEDTTEETTNEPA